MMEDNEAVIKMTTKQRSPHMQHVSWTHRVNIDATFEIMTEHDGTDKVHSH